MTVGLNATSAGRQYLHPEDEGSMDLRNIGVLSHHYTEWRPTRTRT